MRVMRAMWHTASAKSTRSITAWNSLYSLSAPSNVERSVWSIGTWSYVGSSSDEGSWKWQKTSDDSELAFSM